MNKASNIHRAIHVIATDNTAISAEINFEGRYLISGRMHLLAYGKIIALYTSSRNLL